MIITKNLSKRYGRNVAVDALSFSVQPGEVLGFLGANGAGKTTTMRPWRPSPAWATCRRGRPATGR